MTKPRFPMMNAIHVPSGENIGVPKAPADPGSGRAPNSSMRRALEALGQRFAFDVLQDEVVHAIAFLEPVDGSDVGVVERSQGLGLAAQASKSLGAQGEVAGQCLQRDEAIEARIVREVNDAHASAADLAFNDVRADPLGWIRRAFPGPSRDFKPEPHETAMAVLGTIDGVGSAFATLALRAQLSSYGWKRPAVL